MTIKNTQRKAMKYLFAILIMVLLLLVLGGCQTTDKMSSYIDTSRIKNTEFTYIDDSNRTEVVWYGRLKNNTIYNLNEFKITFDLYEGESVQTQTYTYRGIGHGKELESSFSFYVDGKINHVEFVSWSARYDSFWETYKVSIFIAIAVAVVAAVVYIILMCVNDWDLDDFKDVLLAVLVVAAIAFAGGLISSWVMGLILAGGVLLALLLALCAHLIYGCFS